MYNTQLGTLKILFVPYGNKTAPATRYRIYQYLPFLKKEGVDFTVYSVISDNMTVKMIGSPAFNVFQRFLYYLQVVIEKFIRSCKIVMMADKFDLVFLQRSTFSFGLDKILRIKNKNIIFDMDDSIYIPDRQENWPVGAIEKFIKRTEVVSTLRISKCAIVENSHIKNFVLQYCQKAHIITGPIDTVRNFPRQYDGYGPDRGAVIIGWIGTPSTTKYIKIIEEALIRLSGKYKIKVRLIGAGPYFINGVDIEAVSWSEQTEISELHKFDIGVMPMPDNEWTRGKVGCKMLQYMANAIPAVVSYTPTNAEIIEDGANGFLANSQGEWVEKISRLVEGLELRKKIGLAGRKSVEEKYSLEINAPKYLKVLEGCVDEK